MANLCHAEGNRSRNSQEATAGNLHVTRLAIPAKGPPQQAETEKGIGRNRELDSVCSHVHLYATLGNSNTAA